MGLVQTLRSHSTPEPAAFLPHCGAIRGGVGVVLLQVGVVLPQVRVSYLHT